MINNIVEYQILINNINRLGAAYITQIHRER